MKSQNFFQKTSFSVKILNKSPQSQQVFCFFRSLRSSFHVVFPHLPVVFPGRDRRLQPAAGAHPHRPPAPDPGAPGGRGASTGGRWEIRQRALRAGRPLKGGNGGNGGNPQGTGWGVQ